ncbi:MAG: hypothetical protein AB7U46_15275 [Paenirhodobacter sp.]
MPRRKRRARAPLAIGGALRQKGENREADMEILVWLGAVISVAGLAGIVWCIVAIARAKRAGLAEEALRLRLRRVIAINLGALFTSAIGLMMVVIGVTLG